MVSVDSPPLELELELDEAGSTIWRPRAERPPLAPFVVLFVLGALLLGGADWLGERRGHLRRF